MFKIKLTQKIMSLLIITILLSLTSYHNTIYARDLLTTTQIIDQIEIEDLDNGYYLETTISSDLSSNANVSATTASSNTITKAKTTKYKNSSGEVLWSVSIKATFTYDGSTSKCTSCSHSAAAPSKYWAIPSCTSSKSGNKATATAVAAHLNAANVATYTITKSVTISCSPNGTVS